MLRSRKLWLASLALLLATGLGWFWVWRDYCSGSDDFQWIGPKSRDIRETLATLEIEIDLKDFEGSMTIKDALILLTEELAKQEINLAIVADTYAFRNDNDLTRDDLWGLPFEMKVKARRGTVRQVLEGILAQIPARNGMFVAHDGLWLELTTLPASERQRTCYSIGIWDYVRQAWADLTGGEEPRIRLRIELFEPA